VTEPSSLVQTMIRAARAAGDRLKQDFAEIATLEIKHKNGPADPFTIADVRAEQTVKAILSEAYPDYGFLGEEGGLVEGADASNTWICDPLDGTANFLIGLPIWAVNIALQRDGEIVAGVTYIPMLGEMFRAEKGHGAWLNDVAISVSKRQGLEQAVLAVGIPFMGKPRHEQFHAEMQRLTSKVSGVRRLGAGAVDMAYVACGRYGRLLGTERQRLGHGRRRGDRPRGRWGGHGHLGPDARRHERHRSSDHAADPRRAAARIASGRRDLTP
jgi:myo-inositol-1(or 4)-monophosphatase